MTHQRTGLCKSLVVWLTLVAVVVGASVVAGQNSASNTAPPSVHLAVGSQEHDQYLNALQQAQKAEAGSLLEEGTGLSNKEEQELQDLTHLHEPVKKAPSLKLESGTEIQKQLTELDSNRDQPDAQASAFTPQKPKFVSRIPPAVADNELRFRESASAGGDLKVGSTTQVKWLFRRRRRRRRGFFFRRRRRRKKKKPMKPKIIRKQPPKPQHTAPYYKQSKTLLVSKFQTKFLRNPEDCMGCRLIWSQVEMDVGNARYMQDVQKSFTHNCLEAQKSPIFYEVCEQMYDNIYKMTNDYMSQKFTVDEMCFRQNICVERPKKKKGKKGKRPRRRRRRRGFFFRRRRRRRRRW